MAGMLQILTYLLSFYLVMKGVEIFQIGLASSRPIRAPSLVIGGLALMACIVAGVGFSLMQDEQARTLSQGISSMQQSLPAAP